MKKTNNPIPTERELIDALENEFAKPPLLPELPTAVSHGSEEVSLRELEDHARGIHVLTDDRLREIRLNPMRRKLLEAFERQFAPASALGEMVFARVRKLLGGVGGLQPLPDLGMHAGSRERHPVYTLIVERGGVFVEETSVRMKGAPEITESNELVFELAFNDEYAKQVVLPSIKAELSVLSASPERLLGRVEVRQGQSYVKVPVPAELRSLPRWKNILLGSELPFVLILHLSDVPLEVATL